MIMAHKDGTGYYCKVVLYENGEATPRRIHRMQWQDERGVVNCVTGKELPHDLIIYTGKDSKGEHFAKFLGIKTTPPKPWVSFPMAKADLVYVIIGAALVMILKGLFTLATVPY
jgi:hypothetical protein